MPAPGTPRGGREAHLPCGSRTGSGPTRRAGCGETGNRHWQDFDSVKDSRFSLPSPDSSIAIRILAGCTTGAMAVTCAQPTDVVKVRFQAMIRLGTGGERKYRGTMDAYRTIAREEGVRGLWKGKHGTLGQSFPILRQSRNRSMEEHSCGASCREMSEGTSLGTETVESPVFSPCKCQNPSCAWTTIPMNLCRRKWPCGV